MFLSLLSLSAGVDDHTDRRGGIVLGSSIVNARHCGSRQGRLARCPEWVPRTQLLVLSRISRFCIKLPRFVTQLLVLVGDAHLSLIVITFCGAAEKSAQIYDNHPFRLPHFAHNHPRQPHRTIPRPERNKIVLLRYLFDFIIDRKKAVQRQERNISP